MIEQAKFSNAFRHICQRFGREFVADQAAAYFEFLNPLMSTEQFLAASRAVWATAKFFPRPADFLTVAAGAEWGVVMDLMDKSRQRVAWSDEWKGQLTQRGRDACMKLGGVPGMVILADKDLIRCKTAWEEAYEQATTTAALALPAPARAERALPAAGGLSAIGEILPGVSGRVADSRAPQGTPGPRRNLSVERGGQR